MWRLSLFCGQIFMKILSGSSEDGYTLSNFRIYAKSIRTICGNTKLHLTAPDFIFQVGYFTLVFWFGLVEYHPETCVHHFELFSLWFALLHCSSTLQQFFVTLFLCHLDFTEFFNGFTKFDFAELSCTL